MLELYSKINCGLRPDTCTTEILLMRHEISLKVISEKYCFDIVILQKVSRL